MNAFAIVVSFAVVAMQVQDSAAKFNIDGNCGVATGMPSMSAAIAGGTDVSEYEHPWFASVIFKPSEDRSFLCGGVIVSPSYILTAAHCLHGLNETTLYGIRVVVGRKLLSTPRTWIDAKSYIVHEDFRSITGGNDILLVKIPKLTFNDTVQPACVHRTVSKTYTGKSAVVLGRGNEGSGPVSQTVKKATLTVLPPEECRTNPKILCANSPTAGTCAGDSGGPLLFQKMVTRKGVRQLKHFVIGINSYKSSGDCIDSVSGYAAVNRFRKWIAKKATDSKWRKARK